MHNILHIMHNGCINRPRTGGGTRLTKAGKEFTMVPEVKKRIRPVKTGGFFRGKGEFRHVIQRAGLPGGRRNEAQQNPDQGPAEALHFVL
jgi:hypothetical protein